MEEATNKSEEQLEEVTEYITEFKTSNSSPDRTHTSQNANDDIKTEGDESLEAALIGPVLPDDFKPLTPQPSSPINVEVSKDTDTKETDALHEQIVERIDILLSKLKFLDSAQPSLLHSLFVQTMTRLEDWRAGALTIQYMYEKVREMDQLMTNYEHAGTPIGWNCSWDQSSAQYLYENLGTGVKQSTYPIIIDEETDQERGKNSDEAKSPPKQKSPESEDGEILSETEEGEVVDKTTKDEKENDNHNTDISINPEDLLEEQVDAQLGRKDTAPVDTTATKQPTHDSEPRKNRVKRFMSRFTTEPTRKRHSEERTCSRGRDSPSEKKSRIEVPSITLGDLLGKPLQEKLKEAKRNQVKKAEQEGEILPVYGPFLPPEGLQNASEPKEKNKEETELATDASTPKGPSWCLATYGSSDDEEEEEAVEESTEKQAEIEDKMKESDAKSSSDSTPPPQATSPINPATVETNSPTPTTTKPTEKEENFKEKAEEQNESVIYDEKTLRFMSELQQFQAEIALLEPKS